MCVFTSGFSWSQSLGLRTSRATAVLFLINIAVSRAAIAVPSYTVLDLGTLGGTSSRSNGMGTVNSLGQVVGLSYTNTGAQRAFRTDGNAAITPANNLGTLGGSKSEAYGINDSGPVVGYSANTGDLNTFAFRTDANAPITAANSLGSLGGNFSYAYGINTAGEVVGYSQNLDGVFHAFRTGSNAAINPATDDLGGFGGILSRAFAVNASGQAAGHASFPGETVEHAFRTGPNAKINSASDLGTLGGTNSEAYGINDSGQVVGYSDAAGGVVRAFRTAPNSAINPVTDNLGFLGGTVSRAISINSAGQTVGYSQTSSSLFSEHAFFVDVTGPMQDLNALIPTSSGWVLEEAHGINDVGQIAGWGQIGGVEHAFLLTPLPEPGALGLIAVYVIAALRQRRRSR
jgi:probable HAF family extracellular repeat protein